MDYTEKEVFSRDFRLTLGIWNAVAGETLKMVLPEEGIDTLTFNTSGEFEYLDELQNIKHTSIVGERHTDPTNSVSGKLIIQCTQDGTQYCLSKKGSAVAGKIVAIKQHSNVSVPPGYSVLVIEGSVKHKGTALQPDSIVIAEDYYLNLEGSSSGYAMIFKIITTPEIQENFHNGL